MLAYGAAGARSYEPPEGSHRQIASERLSREGWGDSIRAILLAPTSFLRLLRALCHDRLIVKAVLVTVW